MLAFEGRRAVEFCDGLSRRDFLRAGALTAGAVSLSLPQLHAAEVAKAGNATNCIVLFLVGGPSHLETWDPKPGAPENIRGPFRPLRTNVPGIAISEHLPRMARRADRYAIIRSVYHGAAAIHETGHQLMQTGRLSRSGVEHPNYGAVLSHLSGMRHDVPASVLLPSPMGNTGVSISHGQGAGFLDMDHEPFTLSSTTADALLRVREQDHPDGVDPARLKSRAALLNATDEVLRRLDRIGALESRSGQGYQTLFSARARRAFDMAAESGELRANYGWNTFGQSCLLARRLVENGVRLVTVNMFDTVFNRVTWDCHADGGALATTLDDYQDTLCPMFDRAYSALLDDLSQRGLLQSTLVVAMGEFGRTPQLNPRGGRDHWPHVWSILFAGGPVRGGQVIGASDKHGAEPRDRPVHAAEVAASIYHALGVDLQMRLPGPDGQSVPLVEADPVWELFG
jgi:uncharacterized protein (DUF1501 family)